LFGSCLDDTVFDDYGKCISAVTHGGILSEKSASFMPEIANDSNANALDTGLTTLLEFAEKAPNAKRMSGEIAPKVIDKTFGARTATLEKG
jgi:hypothetical protein